VVPLTPDQIDFAIEAVGKWLSIKEDNNLQTKNPDAKHSVLLHRLLTGQEALKYPPPRSFSNPNYSLGEGQPTRITHLRETENVDPLTLRNQVIVDQDDRWVWENDEKTILRFLPTGELYKYATALAITGFTALGQALGVIKVLQKI
jgi:hypothetical protein